jgi:hypothetical protein
MDVAYWINDSAWPNLLHGMNPLYINKKKICYMIMDPLWHGFLQIKKCSKCPS